MALMALDGSTHPSRVGPKDPLSVNAVFRPGPDRTLSSGLPINRDFVRNSLAAARLHSRTLLRMKSLLGNAEVYPRLEPIYGPVPNEQFLRQKFE